MKVHKRIVATGNEWKPCVECRTPFEANEILSAIDIGGNDGVVYWFCEQCTEKLFGHLLRQGWRNTWKLCKADGSREPVDWNKGA